MSNIDSKELKRITGLHRELGSLENRSLKLGDKKGKISDDEYRTLSSAYSGRMQEINGEIAVFKKEKAKNLAAVQKQIVTLQREQESLKKSIEKLQYSRGKDGKDSIETVSKLNKSAERLKSLQKDIAILRKEEAMLLHALDIFSDKNSVSEKSAYRKTGETSLAMKVNPLIIGGLAGIVIIVLASLFIIKNFSGTKDAEIEASPAVEEQNIIQTADEIKEMTGIGNITGSNVNLRQEPNITSPAIRQLQKGDKVSVMAKKTVSESGDAILTRQVQLTMDSGEKIKLDAGKGIVITGERDNSFLVSYAVEDGKSVSGTVEKDAVQRISGDTWYRVTSENGTEGWIFGKYVELQK